MSADTRDPRTTRPQEMRTTPFHFDQRTDASFLHQTEVIRGMTSFAAENAKVLMPPEYWYPADFLPDMSKDGWQEEVTKLQKRAQDIPDEVIVANTIHTATEEALPAYLARLQMFDAFRDRTGTDDHAWAKNAREWTRQEYMHGVFLMRWAAQSGRVDMRKAEEINGNLIRNGFGMGVDEPYQFFMYTKWQEHATRDAHRKTSKLVLPYEQTLAKGLGYISGDESRHERYYGNTVRKIFEEDPEGALIAFARLIETGAVMPTKLVDDGQSYKPNGEPTLFDEYAKVADQLGIFTLKDAVAIYGLMINENHMDTLPVSGEAVKAQEKIMDIFMRRQRIAVRAETNSKARKVDLSRFGFVIPRQPRIIVDFG